MNWTTDRIAELGQLLKNRLTAGQISEVLGITRNAVIGKARRMGLSLDSPQTRANRERAAKAPMPRSRSRAQGNKDRATKAGVKRKRSPAWSTASLPPLPLPTQTVEAPMIPIRLPDSTAEAVISLRGYVGGTECQCRYSFGEPTKPGFHFCSREAVAAKPYCAEHQALAVQPYRPRG